MRLAIQNMATFSASLPTNFRCCCLLNQKSGCLKHWMDVLRGKELVKSSQTYFSIAKIWRRFRGLMKCCLWIVRKWSLRVKPANKLFMVKIIKQRRRAKRQSKYEYKALFHPLLCKQLSVFLSFACDEISAEGESCVRNYFNAGIRQKDGAKLPPFSYVDTEYSTWCRHSRNGPGSILNSTIDLYELP